MTTLRKSPRLLYYSCIIVTAGVSLLFGTTGCGDDSNNATPPSPPTTSPSVASTPLAAPALSKDTFGVPANFQPQYHEESSEDCTVGGAPCRRVNFTVPKGLSRKTVEFNLRAAVEEAYNNFKAVRGIAFARTEGTDKDGPYSAGRVQWGTDDGSDSPDAEAATVASSIRIDYEESYFKPETPAPRTVKRIPEARRKAIFYAIGLSEDRATREADAAYPTDLNTTPADQSSQDVEPNAKMNSDLTEKYHGLVRKEYHISDDQFSDIMTEGIEKHWPTPDANKD